MMVDTASSVGRFAAAKRSRSMTTDVSITPRATRGSATRCGVLVERSVDVGAEPVSVDRGGASECGDRGIGRSESARARGDKLTASLVASDQSVRRRSSLDEGRGWEQGRDELPGNREVSHPL
jgi:hypothetical protein